MATQKKKNYTFSLPVDLLEKFRQYAEEKYIPSMNAGVKEALEIYSQKIQKEKLRNEMTKAVEDPMFMEDLEESMKTFESSDDEIAWGKK